MIDIGLLTACTHKQAWLSLSPFKASTSCTRHYLSNWVTSRVEALNNTQSMFYWQYLFCFPSVYYLASCVRQKREGLVSSPLLPLFLQIGLTCLVVLSNWPTYKQIGDVWGPSRALASLTCFLSRCFSWNVVGGFERWAGTRYTFFHT